jgi:hypothetical protein
MTGSISIDRAMSDPNLLGACLGDLSTWAMWRSVLKAAFAVPLTDEERKLFTLVAGERSPPKERVQFLLSLVGRRGGKSRAAALACCYIATCINHQDHLAPGETGFVLCLAPTQRQAHLVLGYCKAMLESSPVLKQEVYSISSEEIRLRGNIVIAVHPASHRTIRGRTLLAIVLDEAAQFRSEESAVPDIEIWRAAIPGLLTSRGMAIAISTPYGEQGLVYEKHRDNFGKDSDDVLVVKGSSMQFNPTLDEAQIAKELAADPEGARAEWEAEFRANLSAYIDRASLEYCIDRDVHERPFSRSHRFHCFCDPGGGRHDAFAAAFAHAEGERMILDRVFEWQAPYSPADCVDELVGYLKAYSIKTVTGDAYAAGWVENEFKTHGISYVKADKDKSAIYLSCLPMLTSGGARLLDDKRLFDQMVNLNRECGKGGKDMIVKQRGSYDDKANAATGALVYCQTRAKRPVGFRPLAIEGCAAYSPHSFLRRDDRRDDAWAR